MKRFFVSILIMILPISGMHVCAQQMGVSQKVQTLVKRMTLEEKIDYLSGYTSFSLRAIPRLGIPLIRLADGPQGLRNYSSYSTLYPAGILTASTWNRALVHRLGVSLGQDARARGVSVLLGPAVNIYRSPLCGRNYEYFGEDPYLTSETAKAYIEGVQSQGVIATIKHFCVNNQEWNRHHVSSDVDERTLNEIYFTAFRKAVQDARVGAVMDSYNLINGVHATENSWLNIDVLRKQWRFDGILMSDWTSVYSTVNAANNGLDLEMPQGKYFTRELLLPAIKSGQVDIRTIDEKVTHLLSTFERFGVLDSARQAGLYPLDNKTSRQTALAVACEGIVLLKNDHRTLPLRGRTVVMGCNADTVTTGGGSGFVSSLSSNSISQVMKTRQKNVILLTDNVIYDDVSSQLFTDSTESTKGFKGEYFDNQYFEGAPVMTRADVQVDFDWNYKSPTVKIPDDHFSVRWTTYYRPSQSGDIRLRIGGDDGYRVWLNDSLLTGDWGNHSYSQRETNFQVEKGRIYKIHIEYFDNISTAKVNLELSRLNRDLIDRQVAKAKNIVYCTGFNNDVEGEGFDRPFSLSDFQNRMIKYLAHKGRSMTVVLNAGGAVDVSPWLNDINALIMAWYTGQEGGTAVTDILTGRLAPSGKLPISWEKNWKDNPVFNSYYTNNAKKETKTVEYREGLFVGYRGYDKQDTKPLFPFGFGLSYTNFSYSNLNIDSITDEKVTISFDVTNVGNMDAMEIAQVYVHECQPIVVRPEKELKGYQKIMISHGKTKHVSIVLGQDAFEYYDAIQHKFILHSGKFEVRVGTSSEKTPLRTIIEL